MFKKRQATNSRLMAQTKGTRNEELNQVKNHLEIEKSVVKKIKQDLINFDESEPQLIEKYRTSLTDSEIAKTTQVEVDTDDIDEFIRNNLETTKKFKK